MVAASHCFPLQALPSFLGEADENRDEEGPTRPFVLRLVLVFLVAGVLVVASQARSQLEALLCLLPLL